MAHQEREIEIKLPLKDAASGRALLWKAGFRVSRRRVFEENTVFDRKSLELREAGSLLRVRAAGRKAALTYKGPATAAKYKDREELECEVASAPATGAILQRLGYAPVFRYQKYRTEYTNESGQGTAMLDETPIGVYVELEGSPDWIDRTALALGFQESDYITASYGTLFVEWSRKQGISSTEMIFGAQLRGRE